jgi:periplasmic divalent cation tolerance protein
MSALEVVLCTAPNRDVARTLARVVVEERLAACVQLVPGVVSVYRWAGEVQEDDEVLMVLKTAADRRAALEARLLALHPYEVPEVVALEAAHVAPRYLDWLLAETR